jgi:hypothetical protein
MKRLMIAAAAITVTLSVPASASAHVITIQGDWKIGSFLVKRDGTLGGAIDAFGRPASRHREGFTCTVRWPRHGLRIGFYNLGGQRPCRRATGYFSNARARGPHWVTGRGLEIGDGLGRLRELYPNAEFHSGESGFPAGWWLIRRSYPATGPYPGLLARISGRHVVAFHVRYPGGGE